MARSWPVHLAGWPYLDSFSHHQIASPSVLQGHWKNLRAGSANFGRPRRSKAPALWLSFGIRSPETSLLMLTARIRNWLAAGVVLLPFINCSTPRSFVSASLHRTSVN
ncbi:hypothetical protein DTO063F5_2392 [Paecilomyces variotii]|nr:hypothetical protein DTO063F5_2392 [Paecilomyces variotii]